MFSKAFLCLFLAYLFGAGAAIAQDPLKSAPTHYKLAFENEHVQVVYIHYGPHEKSAMHSHPAGVVVNLTNGHLRFTDQDGKTHEVSAIHGEARWFPPFKHQVENLSATTYDGIYIGIKSATASTGGLDVNQLSKQDLAAIAPFLLMADGSSAQPASPSETDRRKKSFK